MEVQFRSRDLERCFLESKQAIKAFGPVVGKKYIQRIQIIQAIPNLSLLMALPSLNCHPLKGDRAGEWAINLTGFVRLIFTFVDEQLTAVQIEEVSKHYDD